MKHINYSLGIANTTQVRPAAYIRRMVPFSVLFFILITSVSQAAISIKGYWRLGENNPNAGNNIPVTNLVSGGLYGGDSLVPIGRPIYTTNVASAAARHAGSSLAISFSGQQSLSNSVVLPIADNFGLEAWVYTRAGNQAHMIADNGNGSTTGWGLRQNGAYWEAEISGKVRFGTGAVALNTWTHLALVRDKGISTLYVNGIPSGTNTLAPETPTVSFTIGADGSGSQKFDGIIDEVRLFNFIPGQFTTNDLLYYAPPPVPVILSQWSGFITPAGASLTASVNPSGNSTTTWVEYGPTVGYGTFSFTNTLPATNRASTAHFLMANLQSCAPYHWRVVAANAAGTTVGLDQVITPALSPEILLTTNRDLTTNTAVLQAIFNPNSPAALSWFEWGTTTQYGQTTLPSRAAGTLFTNVSKLTGLIGGTTYHFRTVVSNCFGLVRDVDHQFRVPALSVVTSLADNGPGSLRAAIASAGEGDTIRIDAEGILTLATGPFVISNSLNIVGRGADRISVNGNAAGRIFEVLRAGSLVVSNLTLFNGLAPHGRYGAEGGGAISNAGTLTLVNCVLRDNAASDAGFDENGGNGGAIYNGYGIVILRNCRFQGNKAGADSTNWLDLDDGAGGNGGAIFNSGRIEAYNCTFNSNTAGASLQSSPGGAGGAIFNASTLLLSGCVFYQNAGGAGNSLLGEATSGGSGGAIFSDYQTMLSLINCTLHQNASGAAKGGPHSGASDGDGGAIYYAGGSADLVVAFCTITGNRSQSPNSSAPGKGGGIYYVNSGRGAASLTNCLMAENIGIGSNLNGPFQLANVILDRIDTNASVTTLTSLQVVSNIPLGDLTDNGGPTLTRALLQGNPAIDAGSDSLKDVQVDQRGFPRPYGAHCDIGAFELRDVAPAISRQPSNQTNVAGSTVSFVVLVTGSFPLSYQWYKGSAPVAGATTASLNLTNVSQANAGSYTVTITNRTGSATSTPATLTVLSPPTITSQPSNVTNVVGTTARFTVVATGSTPLSYQWYKGTMPLSGATSATLSLTNISLANAGSFTVTITNRAGSVASRAATLTVLATPARMSQPLELTNPVPALATFSSETRTVAPAPSIPNLTASLSKTQGVFHLTFTIDPKHYYEIQSTMDLLTWSTIWRSSNVSHRSNFELDDPIGQGAQRFYRLIQR